MTPGQTDTLAIIRALNASYFKGDPFLNSEIMAFCDIESSFNRYAFHKDDGGHWSQGLMQCENTTAVDKHYWRFTGRNPSLTILHIPDPQLYEARVGLTVGMTIAFDYWEALKRHLGRDPDYEEWSASYNEGVGNVLKGRDDAAYINKWLHSQEFWAGQNIDL